jgi:hypothetical protein
MWACGTPLLWSLVVVGALGACHNISSVQVSAVFDAVPGAKLYELQHGVNEQQFFSNSQTVAAPASGAFVTARVDGLAPSTTYRFRVRASTANEVSGWQLWAPGGGWACSTPAAPAGAPTNVRSDMQAPLPAGSLMVAFDAPAGTASGWFLVSAQHGANATTVNTTGARAVLSGLPANARVMVTVRGGGAAGTAGGAADATGTASDPVLLRTRGTGATRFVAMYRVSERQGPADTGVDFLSNHDTGDDAGVAAFVTADPGHGKFIGNLSDAVVTQYCVELRPLQLQEGPGRGASRASHAGGGRGGGGGGGGGAGGYADYLSCNPPDTVASGAGAGALLAGGGGGASATARLQPNATQLCVCRCEADRVIGHDSFVSACGANSTLQPPSPYPVCNCTASSLARSAAAVGRMGVFLPWMCSGFPGSGFDGDGTCPLSVPSGQWFSLPAAAQCAEGTGRLPAPVAPPQEGAPPPPPPPPCSWRRLPSARLLRGSQLLARGWDAAPPADGNASFAQFGANLAVWRAAFTEAAGEAGECGAR